MATQFRYRPSPVHLWKKLKSRLYGDLNEDNLTEMHPGMQQFEWRKKILLGHSLCAMIGWKTSLHTRCYGSQKREVVIGLLLEY